MNLSKAINRTVCTSFGRRLIISQSNVRCTSLHASFGSRYNSSKSNSSLFPSLDEISPDQLTLKKTSANPGWYRITRTRSNQLPVYTELKNDGTVKTVVRKIEGNIVLLKNDLQEALELPNRKIKIKQASNQIIINGNMVGEVNRFLSKAF